MPSVFDDMFATYGSPVLEAGLGEDITHRPLGESGNDATVTAIVTRRKREKDNDHGRGFISRVSIDVATSGLSLSDDDQWVIDSIVYQVEALGIVTNGRRAIELVRREDVTNTTRRRTNSRNERVRA